MQAITPLNAPVSAEGNAVSVLGGSSTAGSTAGTSGAGAPGNAGSQDGSPDATASGTRGLGSGTQSGALVGAVVSAEGGSGTALGDARTTSGSADATPTGGTPARAIGSGADAAEGRHGTAANSCAEKISLSSASGPGPATAGPGSADLGSTAFSAVLFMLLGASLASMLRRKRSTAGNA
ncbi:MAG: hypothetical protein ACTHJJ_02695 [Intrasporangium sp.]|uniref:hypothetical protein n=1 Tax=Intrasporangium sp. TaxID=1925024 RepID=UPI003F7E9783